MVRLRGGRKVALGSRARATMRTPSAQILRTVTCRRSFQAGQTVG